MLARLGRWLRAAGYDAAIAAGGTPDKELLAWAVAERRVVLTRDRHLAMPGQPVAAIRLLTAETVAAQARQVRDALGIDWLKAPFTRCLVDNTPLIPAPAERAGQVPLQSRLAGGPLRQCPECHRLYWPGGHVRRMTARLAEWNG